MDHLYIKSYVYNYIPFVKAALFLCIIPPEKNPLPEIQNCTEVQKLTGVQRSVHTRANIYTHTNTLTYTPLPPHIYGLIFFSVEISQLSNSSSYVAY